MPAHVPSRSIAPCAPYAADLTVISGPSAYLPSSSMVVVNYDDTEPFLLIDTFNWGVKKPPYNFTEPSESDLQFEDKLEIDGLCLSLAGPWSFNFYHWCEELAKVVWVEKLRLKPTYLVPKSSEMYRDSLVFFGVEPERIHVVTGKPIILKEILVTPNVRLGASELDDATHALRAAAIERSDFDASRTRPCFVMRDSPKLVFSKRAIANREEVMHFCNANDIEILDPNELDFSEQIAAFRSRDLMAGVHGAGLCHQLWMRPNSCVIDGLSPKYVNHCFGRLASSLGFNYFMLMQLYVEASGMVCDANNIVIPVDQLNWSIKSSKRILRGDNK